MNIYRKVAGAAVVVGVSASGFASAATTINPIALTLGGTGAGDIIFEAGTTTPQVNTDLSSYHYYETGAGTTNYPGLPVGGLFVSAANPNTSFQFQPYGTSTTTPNNIILNSGTATLTGPATAYSELAFLTEAQGQNGSTYTATVHFSDGSTAVDTISHPDWVPGQDGYNALVTGLSQSASGTNPQTNYPSSPTGTGVHLYEDDFALTTAQQALTISSIDFAFASATATPANAALFAVSGTAVTPEPATLGLLGLAGLGLLARRRRV